MKKRILMLTLVLMIVLSSFSNSFGGEAVNKHRFYLLQPGTYNIPMLFDYPNNQYRFYDKNGVVINGITGLSMLTSINNSILSYINYEQEVRTSNLSGWQESSFPIYVTNDFDYIPYTANTELPVHIDEWGPINSPDYNNPIKTVSIKPSQRILFNYAAADKDKFLKSLSCTPDKSITVHQAYYSGGQVTDLVIKKDTTDLLIGGAPLTLASFPPHRSLNTNEYLGYSQANGGNWVWTDFIPGSNGGPVGTDSNSLVNFTIDTRYCSYRVVSANTGLEITSGGIADVPQVPDDGIYNNNQNPWGPGDITDDYLLDRADYEDGIIGDIQYGFDTLFKFLKMPFELLYKFIMTLGEIIQYALGTVSGFTTALQGIYAILPGPIWFLVIMAISINVFKLIFGR